MVWFLSVLILSNGWAGQSVRHMESSAYDSLLSHSIEERVRRFRDLGPDAFSFLARKAFDADTGLQARWRAITTMGRLDPVRFKPQIEKALADPAWFVRNAGLIALLNADRERAVRWSTQLLSDPALIVRTQAVRNLIALDARESEAALWKGIYDRHNFKGRQSLWIRAHMAEALAKFAGPGRAKAFQRLLIDEDERLHKWAVNGLEASTGMQLSERGESVAVRRQKWLARLGIDQI